MAKNSIGQFIAALRKTNGMTQQDVADRLHVSNKAVSRWERDECAPDLSLIPALAEMFGVTCDELLKGERILDVSLQEKKAPKVEKQVRNIINRTLSDFKTLIWISLAVSVAGLVCMFGISYGFFRPVIGFAVMLLFEAGAFVLAVLAVNRMKDVKSGNELFEEVDAALAARFNNTMGQFSFLAFFAIISAVLLSLPLVLMASRYIESVVTIQTYFMQFFSGIVLILALVFLKCKRPYMEWVTGQKISEKTCSSLTRKVRIMNTAQIGLTIFSALIFVTAGYLEAKPTDGISLAVIGMALGIACLIASPVCFALFLLKNKEGRKELILPGIRNIFLIPSALISYRGHKLGWFYDGVENDMSHFERYDFWQIEFLWYAVALAILVFVIFSLIEKWKPIDKNRKNVYY